MEALVTIISSGFVALLTSGLAIFVVLGKYKEKVDVNEKNIGKHNDKIDSLSDRVSKLEGGVDRDRAHNEYIKRKSPLTLTEKGKALLLDSKGKDYIDNNKEKLIAAIRAKKPKTAYDIQELSKEVIEDNSNEDNFIPIKEFAYRQGFNLQTLTEIFGIYLRDIALRELGFSITDIS